MVSASDEFSDGNAPSRLTRRRLVLSALGLIAGGVATLGLEAVPAAAQPVVISKPRFVLQINGKTVGVFTRLKGISAEADQIEQNEFIYTNGKGKVLNSKQFGKTKPPEVMLQGPGLNKTLWNLHQEVRLGNPAARKTMTLLIEDASKQVVAAYTLVNAWPSKIELSGMKAGATETLREIVTIVCEEIIPINPDQLNT